MNGTVILSGGGAKGLFSFGALEHTRLKPKDIVGISSGALVAYLFANFTDRARSLIIESIKKRSNIFGFDPLFIFKRGYYNTKPLEKLIRSTMDQRLPFVARANAYTAKVDCTTGEVIWQNLKTLDGEELVEAVLSAAVVPGLVQPYLWPYVDAGTKEITPLGFAIQNCESPYTVVLERPIGGTEFIPDFKILGMVEMGYRGVDLMMHAMAVDEIINCETPLTLIQPSVKLYSALAFDRAQEMLDLGRRGNYHTSKFSHL